MDDNQPGTKRRVYDLPQELVDRIVEFQKDRGLPSEVEAARRLLDQALKARDSEETLIGRYYAALATTGDVYEAAKLVLVGHPLVKTIKFHQESIEFALEADGKEIVWLHPKAKNSVTRSRLNEYNHEVITQLTYDASRKAGNRLYDPDEIPF